MTRLRNDNAPSHFLLLMGALVLIGGWAGAASAIQIRVTPSVLDLQSATGQVDGRTLLGGSLGDEFSLGYFVENPGANDIRALFTSIIYDPEILQFVGGVSFPIFEETIPGTPFDRTIRLNPIIDPSPKVTSPNDTLIALNHVATVPPDGEALSPTNATGPDLAIVVTFQILNPDLLTSIDMVFDFGDAAVVNGVSYCGAGSQSCDVTSDAIFAFKNFKIGPRHDSKGSVPVPEPTSAFLIGLGLAGLSGISRRAPVGASLDGGAFR